MLALTCTLWLGALLPGPAPTQASAADQAALTIQAQVRPAIFDRVPTELPKAEPESWPGLFPEIDADALMARVPREDLGRMERARLLYLARRYDQALEDLYGLLETYPDFPLALQVLGTAYFRLRRYGDGAEVFERFLAQAPGQIWTTQALGHCYYSLGNYDQAREHYVKLLAAWPEGQPISAEVYRALSLCAWNTGDNEEALAQINRALEIEPGHWEALCLRAQIYTDAEEDLLDEARADLELARDLQPGEPRPLFLLFGVLYDIGEDELAADLELAWQELDRLTQQARSLEGQLLYAKQPFSMACELAELQRKRRHKEGLRKALDLAVQSRPDDVSPIEVYGFALAAFGDLNDREAGDAAADRMESEAGEDAGAWMALADYYRKTGQTQKRLNALEKHLRITGEG
ncbi:MAG: tetratricopeptide repeat protein [Planctomycetota bacterium]|jgi:tetratricopeptide (TPR) repeat protein